MTGANEFITLNITKNHQKKVRSVLKKKNMPLKMIKHIHGIYYSIDKFKCVFKYNF